MGLIAAAEAETNDGLAGLYYYRARYYHPALQRFVSEDPIGFAGGDVNLYSYVFNQPTGLRDPSGMVVDPISWTAAAIMCGGGATVGMSAVVLSGRKPTVENLAAGAAVGCGAAMLVLVSWIAAGGAVIAGAAGELAVSSGALAGAGTTTLYRAVSHQEFRELMTSGRFQAGPNALAGKFFAENAADAAK